MTPTHTDTPLRRSDAGLFRTPAPPPRVNDDEEERRQARRSVLNQSGSSTTIEDNEDLKSCLKIYSENKLSSNNAWSVTLIDTLSSLLERHHKSLNNFKVAGSSLEASSKVYGLRVDSIHTDVVRMSAGLGKQKIAEEDCEISKEKETSSVEQVGENQNNAEIQKPRKRIRKQVSTVTKNKETINAKLDTNPFTDPIFTKLNSIVGSINSSSRLLENILPSLHSELRLRMDYSFWDFMNLIDDLSICDESLYSACLTIECTKFATSNFDDCILRPNHTGYNITNTPVEQDNNSTNENEKDINESVDKDKNNSQMALAFDIDGDVEPISSDTPTFVDVDIGDYNELSVDEQVAINNCKGLRRAPVMIEDMTPIDITSSHLEYSYRPLDKISQFWAGPSHWKFKKIRNKSIGFAQRLTQSSQGLLNSKTIYQKQRRKTLKLRQQQVKFGDIHDDLFQKLDEKYKSRKSNIQKKWDLKKLKLPTDLQIDHNIFDVYQYARGIKVLEEVETGSSPNINSVDQEYYPNIQNDHDYADSDIPNDINNDSMSERVFEISTEFAGAPDKITKIVVPFAKRAKVVDMKQLKKCCMQLIQKQFVVNDKENIPIISQFEGDIYKQGHASFKKIYKSLPDLLTSNMAEAVSTSVAIYSILHLANDSNLRLFQQDDLNDFQIRQLDIE